MLSALTRCSRSMVTGRTQCAAFANETLRTATIPFSPAQVGPTGVRTKLTKIIDLEEMDLEGEFSLALRQIRRDGVMREALARKRYKRPSVIKYREQRQRQKDIQSNDKSILLRTVLQNKLAEDRFFSKLDKLVQAQHSKEVGSFSPEDVQQMIKRSMYQSRQRSWVGKKGTQDRD